MDLVAISARLVIAATFIVAGIPKLLAPHTMRTAAAALGLPQTVSTITARIVPGLELVSVLLLLSVPGLLGPLLSLALLAGFTALLLLNLLRGRRPACFCFGDTAARPISWWSVARNVALMATTVPVLLAPEAVPAGRVVEAAASLPALGTLIPVILAAMLIQSVVLVALVQRRDATESVDSTEAGLAVGSVAPPFVLPSTDGSDVSLDQLLAAGRPVLLMFTSPGCASCATLVPDIRSWQESLTEAVAVAVISVAAEKEETARHMGFALLDHDLTISRRYRCAGTPGAVLVDAEGRIASPLKSGADPIRALVRSEFGTHVEPRTRGEMAPDFELHTLDGDTVVRSDFTGRMSVLVFWSPDCEFCSEMLPRLWELEDREHRNQDLELVIVSAGSRAAIRRQRFRSLVLLDEAAGATMRSFGVAGTPTAVAIDVAGRISSEPAVGADEVLGLIERCSDLIRTARRLRTTSPVEIARVSAVNG